jgi:cell division protein FtsW
MLMRPKPALMIFVCSLLLIMTGLVMVYSAGAPHMQEGRVRRVLEAHSAPERDTLLQEVSFHRSVIPNRQLMWVPIAIVAMAAAFYLGPDGLRPFRWAIFGVASVGLILCFVPGIGREVNGSYRWIGTNSVRVQPSELTKIAMILVVASFVSSRLGHIRKFWNVFAPMYLLVGVVAVLIVCEPDLGAAGMVFVTVYLMLFIAGVRWQHLIIGLIPVTLGVLKELTVPYRRARLLSFWDPDSASRDDVLQLNQSLAAVSSGGLHGAGLGNGAQKYNFLPEAHTDFIYAVIAEETGFLGAVTVTLLFCGLCLASLYTAHLSKNPFHSLIAVGCASIIGIQAFVNMFVVLGMIPTKGLTLPMISYGGSSLVVSCFAIGLLMHIAARAELDYQPDRSPQTVQPLPT